LCLAQIELRSIEVQKIDLGQFRRRYAVNQTHFQLHDVSPSTYCQIELMRAKSIFIRQKRLRALTGKRINRTEAAQDGNSRVDKMRRFSPIVVVLCVSSATSAFYRRPIASWHRWNGVRHRTRQES